jgi:hypothetical protein
MFHKPRKAFRSGRDVVGYFDFAEPELTRSDSVSSTVFCFYDLKLWRQLFIKFSMDWSCGSSGAEGVPRTLATSPLARVG